VRYGDEHLLPLTMRLRAESDLLLFLRFESFGSASQTLEHTRSLSRRSDVVAPNIIFPSRAAPR
jgi:hypothetical protein